MINYTEKIPNNVDLGRDRILQRALEHWQPAYMGWWYDMGPNESHNYEVYLRTAISVEPDGWAQLDRKSTRLNSSHTVISYAVFCLKKKKKSQTRLTATALTRRQHIW